MVTQRKTIQNHTRTNANNRICWYSKQQDIECGEREEAKKWLESNGKNKVISRYHYVWQTTQRAVEMYAPEQHIFSATVPVIIRFAVSDKHTFGRNLQHLLPVDSQLTFIVIAAALFFSIRSFASVYPFSFVSICFISRLGIVDTSKHIEQWLCTTFYWIWRRLDADRWLFYIVCRPSLS